MEDSLTLLTVRAGLKTRLYSVRSAARGFARAARRPGIAAAATAIVNCRNPTIAYVVGLSGTVSYSVGQRVREFGIRAAIGAAPADQARLVVGSALGMAGAGIVIGLFGALLLSWLITAWTSGLDLDSPLVYAIVGLLQLTIAVAAAAVPGRRAARANPLAALRTE